VVLVLVENEELIGEILQAILKHIGFNEKQERLGQAQEVPLRVAQYTELMDLVHMVCTHPADIEKLQKKITELKVQAFLPPLGMSGT
jgi:predicted metal-dependent peptidase